MKLGVDIPRGPSIDPVPAGMKRPLISVVIPVYNAADYLREALASVLAQDLGADVMEIQVVDNDSADRPEDVIREIGRGRIAFHRHNENIGAIENFNACIRCAKGEWVHLLHADDLVLPGFYEHARRAIGAHPEIGAYSSRHVFTDSDGTWLGLSKAHARAAGIVGEAFVERQLTAQQLHFASLIIRRSVYEALGGFRATLAHCCDWEMWNKLILFWPLYYDPELLACNRLHAGSATSHMIRTGRNVREERACISLSASYFPRTIAKRIYSGGMKATAIRAIRSALQAWRRGEGKVVLHQLFEALRCVIAGKMAGLTSLLHLPHSPADAANEENYPQPHSFSRPFSNSK